MKDEKSRNDIYASPLDVKSVDECHFYHTMELPGEDLIIGDWDLRGKEEQYLGGLDIEGKRILELGPASGYLSFYMEKAGAEVVSYDLSENQDWDIVPFHQYDYKKHISSYKKIIKRSNCAYWYAHKAYQSNAKLVYGSVYEIPEEIGLVDITTVCSILLHVRDPFLALQKALRLTRETVIITDMNPEAPLPRNIVRRFAMRLFNFVKRRVFKRKNKPYMVFAPDFRTIQGKEDWWQLSPEAIVNFIGILGFEKSTVTYHTQQFNNGESASFYTVVGERTREIQK